LVSLIKREYDYALRITAYLGSLYPGNGRTIAELAKNLDISKSLATRISYQLIKGGILRSRQGRYGGIFLDRDPSDLVILDVLEAMNYDSTMNACLQEEAICPLVHFCPIRKKFSILEESVIKQLRGIRIRDILIRESKLKTVMKQAN